MKYLIVLEESEVGFGAFVPDLPGCIATGESKEDAVHLIQEAITFHIEGLKEDSIPVPPPSCTSEFVDIRRV